MFKENIRLYHKDINDLLDTWSKTEGSHAYLSSEKAMKTYDILGKKIKMLPQTAYMNAILEFMTPNNVDFQKEELYYLGDFSQSHNKKYMKKVFKKMECFTSKSLIDEREYMAQIDKFNLEYADLFECENHRPYSYLEIFNKAENTQFSDRDLLSFIMEQYVFSFSLYSYAFDEKVLLCFNGILAFEELCRVDEKARDIIMNGVGDEADSVFELASKRMEAFIYIVDTIKKNQIEPLATMLSAGAGVRADQLIGIVIGLVAKPFINEPSDQLRNDERNSEKGIPDKILRLYGNFIYPYFLKGSFLRGTTEKNEVFLCITNAITSVMVNKNLIAPVGDMNRQLTVLGKFTSICPDDTYKCSSVWTSPYTITNKDSLKNIQGMYDGDGNKVPPLSQYDSIKGQTLNLRMPSLCNGEHEGKGICRYCVGDELYYPNRHWPFRAFDREPNNIGTVIANIIGKEAQHSLLQFKHSVLLNAQIPLYWIIKNKKKHFDLAKFKLAIVYAYMNHVFFNYDGKEIYPDDVELFEPELMMMPYSNELSYFSKTILVSCEGETFMIESDTHFYVEEDDYISGRTKYKLKHLFNNIGISGLYYRLEGICKMGTKSNRTAIGSDQDLFEHFMSSVSNLDPRWHVSFFHILFRGLISASADTAELVDFSKKDATPTVNTLLTTLRKSMNLSTRLEIGFYKNLFTADDIYNVDDNIKKLRVTSTDAIIR